MQQLRLAGSAGLQLSGFGIAVGDAVRTSLIITVSVTLLRRNRLAGMASRMRTAAG